MNSLFSSYVIMSRKKWKQYLKIYFIVIDLLKGNIILPWKTLSRESCLEGGCT